MEQTKFCKNCAKDLPITNFHKHSRSKDGLQFFCKQCKLNNNYEWLRNNPGKERMYRNRLNYKIEPEEYERMTANGCDVCGSFERLCIDHDHNCCPGVKTCGKCIRGILCKPCNEAEGKLKSDKNIIRALADYVEKWEINNE